MAKDKIIALKQIETIINIYKSPENDRTIKALCREYSDFSEFYFKQNLTEEQKAIVKEVGTVRKKNNLEKVKKIFSK